MLRELQVAIGKAIFLSLQLAELLLVPVVAFAELYELLGHLAHGGILAAGEADVGLRESAYLLEVGHLV